MAKSLPAIGGILAQLSAAQKYFLDFLSHKKRNMKILFQRINGTSEFKMCQKMKIH